MDYDAILYEYEDQYNKINEKHLQEFINLFLKESKLDITIDDLISFYQIEDITYYEIFGTLREYIYNYYPEFISLFHQILENSGYQINHNMIDMMYILGYGTNKKIDKKWEDFVKLSPYIDEVEYNSENKKITIYSKQFGNYSFYAIRDYFRDNFDAMQYIRKNRNELRTNCHRCSGEFIAYLNSATLITELCPYLFEGTFYHSVIRDESGLLIDIANEIVYDDNINNNLFQSQIICETKKEDIENNVWSAISASNNPNIEEELSNALLLAVYEQGKNYGKGR